MRSTVDLLAGRARAWRLRFLGAEVGPKCSIGARLHVRNAHGISVGTRVEMEHDLYLKLVATSALLRIGDYAFVGRGCEIDVALSVIIGAHTLLAPGVFITDHNHQQARGARLDEQGIDSSAVVVGADVWLGTGCTVLAGVTIGDGAIVGAGAVVTGNVKPYTIVAGVPARFIRTRE